MLAELAPAEEKDEDRTDQPDQGLAGWEDLTASLRWHQLALTGRSVRRIRARPVPPEPRVLGDPVARQVRDQLALSDLRRSAPVRKYPPLSQARFWVSSL